MARGRKPKSTQELEDQGTYRKDRHASRIDVVQSLPEDPANWLTAGQKKVWGKWYEVLQRNDILKETDEVAFGEICVKYDRILQLRKEVQKEGFTIFHSADNGAEVVKKNPKYEILAAEEKDLLRLLTEFGMTPASRSKVKTALDEGENPFLAAMKSA